MPNNDKLVTIEPVTIIEFSKYGAFAKRHHASGRIEDIPVEQAMKDFDQLAADGAFER